MESLQLRAGKLLKDGLASNTQLAYATGLNAFQNFRIEYKLDRSWPTNEKHVLLFIAYCFEVGRAPTTITTYLAGVNYFHKIHGWVDFHKSFITQKIIEGCRRRGRPSKECRAPVSKKVLIAICAVLPDVCYTLYEVTLFHALFTVAYFGLFRVGELVASSGSNISLFNNNIAMEHNSIVLT